MTATPPRIFDFDQHRDHVADATEAVRRFAAADAFRSAMVEELELDDDFYRRPVRPEDLSFIKFSKPVTRDTVTRLPFLAAQRILLAANELEFARMPRDGAAPSVAEAAAFYAPANRLLGAAIRPFLESVSFDMLERGPAIAAGAADVDAAFRQATTAWDVFWEEMGRSMQEADYVDGGLRFTLIQNRCLGPSKRHALQAAAASGFFAALPPALHPLLQETEAHADRAARVAAELGVGKREHSYWQFYLSTSLASCNLLHALRSHPAEALRMVGAGYVAEAEAAAFGRYVEAGAHTLGGFGPPGPAAQADGLQARFAAVLDIVARDYGSWGLGELGMGVACAAALAEAARTNLGEQLRWLSSVERYRDLAHAIDARIQRECPNIDRETFVEPREMCSTTHVHDDHRLVVIESGKMVFWGNVGMTLRLEPGEMVLVPQGRLHGSSIESDECTYHQPIIPDDWIAMLNR